MLTVERIDKLFGKLYWDLFKHPFLKAFCYGEAPGFENNTWEEDAVYGLIIEASEVFVKNPTPYSNLAYIRLHSMSTIGRRQGSNRADGEGSRPPKKKVKATPKANTAKQLLALTLEKCR